MLFHAYYFARKYEIIVQLSHYLRIPLPYSYTQRTYIMDSLDLGVANEKYNKRKSTLAIFNIILLTITLELA